MREPYFRDRDPWRMARVTSLTLILILAGVSSAEEKAPVSPLEPLSFLIGKWEETGSDPPGAADETDMRRNHVEMAWDLDGTVIRRSESRSEDGKRWRVTGVIAWNPVSEQIEFQEHADWGNFVRGTIDVVAEGEIRRNLEVSYPDGSTANWRTTVRSTGPETFRTRTEKLVQGDWVRQWVLEGRKIANFAWDVSAAGRPGGFPADDAAMAQFEPYIGIWGPPPDEEDPGVRIVLEWGIPHKTVRFSHFEIIDEEPVQTAEALIGYHYGRQRIEFLEFTRDGLRPFEVMNEGFYEFREDGTLVRRYRSHDPDMSSRENRETYTMNADGSRLNTIEYRDDAGAWRLYPVGPVRSVRYETLRGRMEGE